MNHNHSIGTDFMTHGIQGIETHYKTGNLMHDAQARQLINNIRTTGDGTGMRHRLGGVMISLGAAIAGKTHDIQARQATMPSPSSAKSGVVPTH